MLRGCSVGNSVLPASRRVVLLLLLGMKSETHQPSDNPHSQEEEGDMMNCSQAGSKVAAGLLVGLILTLGLGAPGEGRDRSGVLKVSADRYEGARDGREESRHHQRPRD